jgi:hypothetical protein
MLPDFPELKAELERLVLAKLREKIRSRDPLVLEIRSFTQHEGNLQRYQQRPTGNVVEEGFEMMSTEFTTSVGEVPTLLGPKLDQKLDEIADDAGTKLAKSFYKKVSESCDKAGTTVNAQGEPMSAELVLQMLSTVQTDFDERGQPTTAIVIHPDMAETARKIAEQIENDPKLKQRADEITRIQREAWAARESNRKLVD